MYRLDFVVNGENFITSNGLQYRVIGQRPIDIESIEIHLYQTDSDPRTLAKNLSSATVLKGTLRSASSFINPTITILSGTPFFWNYVYIPSMQRYYFVRDVRIVRKNLYEVSLQCDVLMTYKDAILNLETRVLRSESRHNWELTDTLVPADAKTIGGRYAPVQKNGVWAYLKNGMTWDARNNTASYGHLLVKFIHSYSFDMNDIQHLPPLGYSYMTIDIRSLAFLMIQMQVELGEYAEDYKSTDFISDVKWIPCHIGTSGGFKPSEIYFGTAPFNKFLTVSGLTMRMFPDAMRERETVTWVFERTPQEVSYRNNPPFTTMAIDFSPFGQVPLDSQTWGNERRFYVLADIDSFTGDAILYAQKESGYRERLAQANVAIPFDLSEVVSQERASTNSLITGLSSIASAPMSILSPNPSSIVTAGVSLAKGISQMFMGQNLPPIISRVSGNGGNNANFRDNPELIVSRHNQEDPNLKTQGWLLNKNIRLSKLHGYCLVDSGVHIEGQIVTAMATKPEIEEIETLLSSGVILP